MNKPKHTECAFIVFPIAQQQQCVHPLALIGSTVIQNLVAPVNSVGRVSKKKATDIMPVVILVGHSVVFSNKVMWAWTCQLRKSTGGPGR